MHEPHQRKEEEEEENTKEKHGISLSENLKILPDCQTCDDNQKRQLVLQSLLLLHPNKHYSEHSDTIHENESHR